MEIDEVENYWNNKKSKWYIQTKRNFKCQRFDQSNF